MGVRNVTDGLVGWSTASLTRHRKNERGTGKRTVDAFHAPEDYKTLRALKMQLCMGANSPCETCEVQCGYGRRCVELRAKEAAKCSV